MKKILVFVTVIVFALGLGTTRDGLGESREERVFIPCSFT